MKLHLFQFPLPTDPELPELNAYLAANRVVSMRSEVVPHRDGSMLTVLVETSQAAGRPPKSSRIDYRALLSEEDFAVFSRLRTERKIIADAEGIPI